MNTFRKLFHKTIINTNRNITREFFKVTFLKKSSIHIPFTFSSKKAESIKSAAAIAIGATHNTKTSKKISPDKNE